MYLCQNWLINSYFILWVQYCFVLFLKLSIFRHWESIHLAPVLLWHISISGVGSFFLFFFCCCCYYFNFFNKLFLTFWNDKMLIIYISFSSPKISNFSKVPWVLLLEKGYWKQRSGCCDCGGISFRASQQIEQRKKKYMKHMCIYMSINISLCNHICIKLKMSF